jgi:hypothetical protein
VVSVALLAAMLLVGLVFVLEADSWYIFWKALHVIAAVTWVGGGLVVPRQGRREPRCFQHRGD